MRAAGEQPQAHEVDDSTGELTALAEARLPRTGISLLRRQFRASLAATSGVEGPADVVKYLLAGADVVMTASALIRHGPQHTAVLLNGLSEWMARTKGTTARSEEELKSSFSAHAM